MKRVLLATAALTSLTAGAFAVTQAPWSVTQSSGGKIYSASLTSPTVDTQVLYTKTIFTNGSLGGAISIDNNVGYGVKATNVGGAHSPSLTINITTSRAPDPTGATAISATLVSATLPTTVTYATTPSTTFANNVGPITGIQFHVGHDVTDTEVIRVYENPWQPVRQ